MSACVLFNDLSFLLRKKNIFDLFGQECVHLVGFNLSPMIDLTMIIPIKQTIHCNIISCIQMVNVIVLNLVPHA